jgi:hypothetical protein
VVGCTTGSRGEVPGERKPVIRDNNNTDVSVPLDKNIIKKEAKMKLKYKNNSIELQGMWNIKHSVLTIITGAKGIINKGLKLSGNNTRKAINTLCTKNSCSKDSAHNKEDAKGKGKVVPVI